MTEKEFHKMKPQDLIQLLLAQGIESARLQEDLEKKKTQLALLQKDNDILKSTLNDKDAATDQLKSGLDLSDARIRELEAEMVSLQADPWIDLKETGNLLDAAQKLHKIFEYAQKEADAYLSGEKAAERPMQKKIKKEEVKHLKPTGKTTDKKDIGKELEEVILQQSDEKAIQEALAEKEPKAQQPLHINGFSASQKTAGSTQQKLQLEEVPANENLESRPLLEPWPDEALVDGLGKDSILQDPWPDEIDASHSNFSEVQQPASEKKPPKELFGSFIKKRAQKKKTKKI